MQPPAGSQVSRVPAQRTPQEDLAPSSPPAQPALAAPRRRMRTVLTVAAVMLTVLCLSGGVTGYILYNRAVAPDRSSPDVVVDNYLRAFLVDRNDARANLYACNESSSGAGELHALRSDIEAREKRFDTRFVIKWGGLEVTKEGKVAEVAVELVLSASVDGILQSDRQWWRLSVQIQDNWRVCDARQVG